MSTDLLIPVSPASLRRLYASDLTPIDCDLNTGSNVSGTGAATDGTAAINAFLQSATADAPVQLIMDGGVLMSGIVGATGGHWSIVGQGWDTGFFVATGADTDGIVNAGGSTATGSNIQLRNFKLNGNRGNGSNGNCNTASPPDPRYGANGAWKVGLQFYGITNLLVEDVWVYEVPTYAVLLWNCIDVRIRGSRVECVERGINTDGVHLNGGCTNIMIHNCWFGTGDDAIAINCPEGNSGNISKVVVDSCIFDNCLTWCRPYTYTSGSIDSVLFSNCSGSASNRGFNGSQSDGNGKTGFLAISNCDIAAPWLGQLSLTGIVQVSNVRWTPTTPPTGSPIFFNVGANVDTLMLDGVSVVGMTVPDLLVIGATVNLRIGHLEPTNITALYTGTTPTISGPGVLSTGFALPDSAMDNNALYLSSDASGAPSVKVGGTAQRLTLG